MRFYNTFCLFILVFLLFSCAEYRSQKNYPDKKYEDPVLSDNED